ncbi:hypothetical protein V2I52_11590 [Brenneria sp. g21c3]|uniref:hypothetical protein n=1 Tax=Brenneria sp. g21c3 TaxID=3093893 RepID=UPI002EA4F638|nr:hypothetical protein [Brenneria sp. g21c3]
MAVYRRPAKQGQLDGACGFYAIVNALHVLEPELEQKELFYITLSAFLSDGNPMGFVDGTRRGTIKNTLSRVISLLNKDYSFTDDKNGTPYQFGFNIPFWIKDKERNRKTVLDTLSSANYRRGQVCILGYEYCSAERAYNHWTVIKNVRDNILMTFDSDEEARTISLDHARVDSGQGRNNSRPYNIISGDIFIIYKTEI